jgi:hypothetical protein
LIFKTETGTNYLITGSQEKKKKLQQLKGLPLLLTGKTTPKEGTFKSNSGELPLYKGELEVKLYNTDYDKQSEEKVSVLGTLETTEEDLVLLTPDQQVIRLVVGTDHPLAKQGGKEIVVTGKLTEISDYESELEVNSIRIIE